MKACPICEEIATGTGGQTLYCLDHGPTDIDGNKIRLCSECNDAAEADADLCAPCRARFDDWEYQIDKAAALAEDEYDAERERRKEANDRE